MAFYRALVAQFYDLVMRRVERLCLHNLRAELLRDLAGEVAEIGAGTGTNLPYYPPGLKRLVLCEPDPSMRAKLQDALCREPKGRAFILACSAEYLALADASVDYLVSSLALCSVADQRQALDEAYRVLRPGGSLVLMEHVAATPQSRLYFWQRFWQPLWKMAACNCHLTRRTAQLVTEVGFTLDVRQEFMRGAPAIAAPMIVGRAIRSLH